jgi:bacterioferritin-associated ferredoxin
MYVCICNAVTDHEIVDAVSQGVRSLDQLEQVLLVGTCCGKCRDTACELLEQHRPARPTLVRSA